MKPFTFMTLVLGLILGFLLTAGRHPAAKVSTPSPHRPVVVHVQYLPDQRGSDAEDGREDAEGLPVPIVPGTRVSEAEILPPRTPPPANSVQRPHHGPRPGPKHRDVAADVVPAPSLPSTVRSIPGRLSATLERARNDARLQLEHEVTEWLTPEVPTHWKPPAHLVTQMVQKTDVHPIVRDYGTVYETTLDADFAPFYRGQILAAYQREVVGHRLTILGGSLGFILSLLGAVAGYIRADEATKGYYTHWLRALATAGVGAAGVLIYQTLA